MNTVGVAASPPSEAPPAWRPSRPAGESRSGEHPSLGTIVTSMARSTVVVALVGEHDLTTSAALERKAAGGLGACDQLAVDLTEATFIDSSVINALTRLARQARSRGVTFQVVAPIESHPRRVLDLMGLESHLGCVDALRELGAARADDAGA